MKRFGYILLALLPFAFCSCSSDDDLPQVDISVNFSGASEQDGTLYVVAGDVLSIDGLKVTPVEGSKHATLGATAYYWNFQYVGTTIVEPFGMSINTAGMEPGRYILQINATVFQLDKTAGVAYISYPVVVVATPDDLPDGVPEAQGGSLVPDTDIRSDAVPTA